MRSLIDPIVADIRAKRRSAVEVTTDYLDRAEKLNPTLNAFITIMRDEAFRDAHALDLRIAKGEAVGRLAGVPVVVKDNILVRDVRATGGSKILENYIAPYDATVITRLKKEDAIIIGKTNLDEFAMGSSTEYSAYGVTRNPWDLTRVPGGSSGGSIAAVAADVGVISLGSETGGSIRQPAALCGVAGLKPTYGRVSRYGVMAMTSSFDQIGPAAKTVYDAALTTEVIAGKDPQDATSVGEAVPPYTSLLGENLKGLKVGVPKEYFVSGVDPEIDEAVKEGIRALERLGASVTTISLPHTAYAIPTYYIIVPAEVSSNLARYDGIKYGHVSKEAHDLNEIFFKSRAEGFGKEAKRRIMIGSFVLSAGYYEAYYLKAQRVRTFITQDFTRAFQSVDVIVAPTSPTAAFKIGEKTSDPVSMYLADIFTAPANIAGICGLSVPCGFTTSGLPIGLQILGPQFGEVAILKTAYHYEQAHQWNERKPNL